MSFPLGTVRSKKVSWTCMGQTFICDQEKKKAKQMNGKKRKDGGERGVALSHCSLLPSGLISKVLHICHSHQHQQAWGNQTWAFSPATCRELKEQEQCQQLQLSLDTILQCVLLLLLLLNCFPSAGHSLDGGGDH